MIRDTTFGLRVNPEEMKLISGIAQRLERTEADSLRLIVRAVGREFGLTQDSNQADGSTTQSGEMSGNRAA